MSQIVRRMLLVLIGLAWAVPVTAASSDVELKPILSGYTKPVLVTHAPIPPRILFVVEQRGLIKRARLRDGSWSKAGVLLDIRDRVQPHTAGDVGLLGLAFHPGYRQNGRFYVAYTRRGDGASVLSEFRRGGSRRAAPSTERVLMIVPQPDVIHHVAQLTFGPDGLLYIGSGDGGPGGDPEDNAQNMMSRLGKILRIDPLDPDGAGPMRFSIPRSNPFVGKPGLDAIWASGLRNPWRFSFDRKLGHLWIGDVGQNLQEEVNRSRANRFGQGAGRGRNYGWNDCQASLEWSDDEGDADDLCSQGDLPIFDYPHDATACAVVGGFVHRGPGARTWRGLYVAADFCGSLFVLDQRGRPRLWKTTPVGPVSFGEDRLGRIFAVNRFAGEVYRLRFVGERPDVLTPASLERQQQRVKHRQLPARALRIR